MNCEKGDTSGRLAPLPFTPVIYRLPLVSVVTYSSGLTGLRSNNVVAMSGSSVNPVTLPSALSEYDSEAGTPTNGYNVGGA